MRIESNSSAKDTPTSIANENLSTTQKNIEGNATKNVQKTQALTEIIDYAVTSRTYKINSSTTTLVNPNGAPALEAPSKNFSSSEMVEQLSSAQTKIQSGSSALIQKKAQDSISSEKQDRLDESSPVVKSWIEKAKETAQDKNLNRIYSWASKVGGVATSTLGFSAALGATIATGGAALPMLALATVGLTSATIGLANQISQERGSGPISVNQFLTDTSRSFLKDYGMSEQTLESTSKAMAGAIGVALPIALLVEPSLLGSLGQGIAELAGVDKKNSTLIGNTMGAASTLMLGVGTAVASGGTSSWSATFRISKAIANGVIQGAKGVHSALKVETAPTKEVSTPTNDDSKSKLSKADKQQAVDHLQRTMEKESEQLESVFKGIQDGIQTVNKQMSYKIDDMSFIAFNQSIYPL